MGLITGLGRALDIASFLSGGAGGAGGVFNVGKSKAQLFDKGDAAKAKTTFKDVAGLRSGCVKSMTVTITQNKVDAEIDPKCEEQLFGKTYKEGDKIPNINALVPSVEEFSKLITELQKEKVFTGEVSYKEGKNYMEMFLYSILPILLLVQVRHFTKIGRAHV